MLNRCTVTALLIGISLIYSFKAWQKQERNEAGLSLAYLALAFAEFFRS